MIRFRYQPTLDDYIALNRYFLWKHLRRIVPISFILVAAYLALPLISQSHWQGNEEKSIGEIYLSGLAILILPGIVSFIYISTHFAVRKRWKAAEELRLEKQYEINDEGVRVTGVSLSGFLEWKHFTSAELQKGFYFLKTAQNQFHYFPASIVPDVQLLGALLAAKIPEAKVVNPSRKFRFRKVFFIWILIIAAIVFLYFFNPTPH